MPKRSGRTMKWPKGRHPTRVSQATCRGSRRVMVPMVSNKFRHMDTQALRDTISQHGCATLDIPKNLLVDHEVSTVEQKVEMSLVRLKRVVWLAVFGVGAMADILGG